MAWMLFLSDQSQPLYELLYFVACIGIIGFFPVLIEGCEMLCFLCIMLLDDAVASYTSS